MARFSTLNGQYIIYSVLLVFIVSLLVACNSSDATPTADDISQVSQATAEPEETVKVRPTLSPPVDGNGIIAGYLVNQNGPMPEGTIVWVLELKRTEEGYGVYYLNTLSTPSYRLESDDYFQTTSLAPGEYVIVAGISPDSAAAINREDGQAKIFELESDSILDIGRQLVTLAIPPDIEELPLGAYPPLAATPTSAYP